MKTCYKCRAEKELSEFHKNRRQRDGYQNYCKGCAKVRNAEYYRSTPERNAQRRQSNTARRISLRANVWIYLATHPCVDCGESDPVVLEFDHVRGVKVREVSRLVSMYVSWDTVAKEIAKCDVRCANCHRRVTAKRAGWAVPS